MGNPNYTKGEIAFAVFRYILANTLVIAGGLVMGLFAYYQGIWGFSIFVVIACSIAIILMAYWFIRACITGNWNGIIEKDSEV